MRPAQRSGLRRSCRDLNQQWRFAPLLTAHRFEAKSPTSETTFDAIVRAFGFDRSRTPPGKDPYKAGKRKPMSSARKSSSRRPRLHYVFPEPQRMQPSNLRITECVFLNKNCVPEYIPNLLLTKIHVLWTRVMAIC